MGLETKEIICKNCGKAFWLTFETEEIKKENIPEKIRKYYYYF